MRRGRPRRAPPRIGTCRSPTPGRRVGRRPGRTTARSARSGCSPIRVRPAPPSTGPPCRTRQRAALCVMTSTHRRGKLLGGERDHDRSAVRCRQQLDGGRFDRAGARGGERRLRARVGLVLPFFPAVAAPARENLSLMVSAVRGRGRSSEHSRCAGGGWPRRPSRRVGRSLGSARAAGRRPGRVRTSRLAGSCGAASRGCP